MPPTAGMPPTPGVPSRPAGPGMRRPPRMRKRVRRPPGEPSSARDAIILMIVVIAVAVYAIFFGLQTLIWVETHRWAHADSWLADVPKPIAQHSIAAAPPPMTGDSSAAAQSSGTQLKAYAYEFKVPWSGKFKTAEQRDYTEFRFDSGEVVMFFDPEVQRDLLREITSGEQVQFNQFRNVFIGQSFGSNYDLYNAVYGASPAAVSPWIPLRDAMRINQLLLWKLSFGVPATPGIYAIASGSNRGFEFGDPSGGRPVALRIFDGRDKQFQFFFLVAAGSGAKISQDDIDLAVESLEPIPLTER